MTTLSEVLAASYEEVEPLRFYRELFPVGSLSTVDNEKGKYVSIAIEETAKENVSKFLIHDDLKPIEEIVKRNNFAVLSPVGYCGRFQRLSNARELYAITFDLDGLQVDKEGNQKGFNSLLSWIECGAIPMPTYLVSSGTGLHLYYFLETPLRLYNYVIEPLREYRLDMTVKLWHRDITTLFNNIQIESITQGFRMVGSKTKIEGVRVRAFKSGKKWSIEELNSYVSQEAQIPTEQPKSRMTIEQAKELFPDWYEKRVVKGIPRKTYVCNEGLYYWWIEKLKNGENKSNVSSRKKGIQDGYRYNGLVVLAIYAVKCGIPKKQMIEDGLKLVEMLDSRTVKPGNNFKAREVYKAANAYDSNLITVSRAAIEAMTNIDIPPQKRNYRKQITHLKLARKAIEGYRDIEELDKTQGRKPSTYEAFKDYLKDNPKATNKDLEISLAVDRKTIFRHKQKLRKEYEEEDLNLKNMPLALLSTAEKIEIVLEDNPEATVEQIAASSGLSVSSIYNYKRQEK